MEVLSVEEFWEKQFKRLAYKYVHNPDMLTELHELVKLTWKQADYTNNNAPR